MATAAEILRDEGMRQAVEHADAVHGNWSERAMDMLKDYLELLRYGLGEGQQFTSEMVREYAEQMGLPDPPDKRAWGAVMVKAARAGLIVKKGWTTSRNPKVHCSPTSLWEIK